MLYSTKLTPMSTKTSPHSLCFLFAVHVLYERSYNNYNPTQERVFSSDFPTEKWVDKMRDS